MISVLTPSIRPKGLAIVQRSLREQTFTDFEFLVEIGLGLKPDLNKALNKMLSRARGEIVVIWEDYIKVPSYALRYILEAYDGDFVTYPVGKTLDWKNVKWDWRIDKSKEVEPRLWEMDFASAPLKAFFEVGGFDEDFDRGWSCENVWLAERAAKLGYKFFCDVNIKALAYDHDKVMEHPFRMNKNTPFNSDLLSIKRSSGDIKLHYLDRYDRE